MIRSRKIGFLAVAALSLVSVSGFCVEARAGIPGPQSSPSAANSQPIRAKFTVVRMLYNAIEVRGIANPLENHTFSYSDAIRGKMEKLFNQGGYQYGDQVEISYQPGADVALKIKGKRSKSH